MIKIILVRRGETKRNVTEIFRFFDFPSFPDTPYIFLTNNCHESNCMDKLWTTGCSSA